MRNNLTSLDEKRAQYHGMLLLLTFGLLFIPSFTILSDSGLRFAIYLLPVMSFFYWILSSPSYRFLSNTRFIIALMLYAALVFVGALLSAETIDKLTWVNAMRPIFYLAAFIPLMVFTNKSVKILVIIFAITTLILWLTGSGTTRGAIDLEGSQGPLESGLAFPLGGILIYFILQKSKRWSLFTFFLFFLAFKRIAFAAVLVILALMLINRMVRQAFKLSEYRVAWASMFFILAVAALINVFYFEFFEVVAMVLGGSEQSVSQFTMGRLEEYQILFRQYGNQNLTNLLLGNGAGDATRRLVEITINYPLQVHNSFLLYFYDFGVMGFSLFLLSFLVIFSRTSFGIYLFAYNIIIMVTDNTFSHHYHQITYFILIAAMQYETHSQKRLQRQEHEDG
ncbi:MAG: hypothetical protein P8P30_05435 [Rickettsiales bacterium]|nr:hypothetical protein [Rickettsiales bacterium]